MNKQTIDIRIAHEIDDAAVSRIRDFVEFHLRDNITFGGMDFTISRDDYTCIEGGGDNLDVVELFSGIQNLINESKGML